MINQQVPLPARAFDGTYLVHSMFLTIQGEGPFSGDAAIFVRLEGCNLQCNFCDTDYTEGERARQMTADEIADAVSDLSMESTATLVVITGGEPFRQDLFSLVKTLRANGARVQIETNGTLAPSDAFKEHCEQNYGVAIVVSPKAQFVDPWIETHAIAFKYVLSHDSIDESDGLPINVLGRKSQRVARPAYYVPHIYVSPADMGNDAINTLNHKVVIDSTIKFGYRAQMQIHKLLNVE